MLDGKSDIELVLRGMGEVIDADIQERALDELAALRRDRETLRKVMDVVERRGSYSNFDSGPHARSRFEEIERLVRQEQEKGND